MNVPLLEREPSPLPIVERRDGGPEGGPAHVLLRRIVCACVEGSGVSNSSIARFCIGSK